MTTTINGRTPEEIKKGLENGKSNCEYVECCETDCPYESNCKPGSNQMVEVPFALVRDALECIQQLERERDAAVEILHDFKMCAGCNHKGCADCRWFDDMTMKNKDLRDNWKWRGVQKGVE